MEKEEYSYKTKYALLEYFIAKMMMNLWLGSSIIEKN